MTRVERALKRAGDLHFEVPDPMERAGLALKRLSKTAGIIVGDHHLKFHDFRHTCATNKARRGWNEAQLWSYFGWLPGSIMPSHYVHLAHGDMRERIRRDAGIDEFGFQSRSEVTEGDMDQLLKRTLMRLLRER